MNPEGWLAIAGFVSTASIMIWAHYGGSYEPARRDRADVDDGSITESAHLTASAPCLHLKS